MHLAEQVRAIIGSHVGIEIDHVIPVSRIPKTTSGKIQRSHLTDAYLDGEFDSVLPQAKPESPDAAAVEDDPVIAQLIAICREFARDLTVGPDDNLFEVGISSLTLTEIVLALDEQYPDKVDINDLFDYPTIRELSEFVRR